MPPRRAPSDSRRCCARSRLTDEHRLAAHAHGAQHRPGDQLVARAEHADQSCDEDRADDVEAEGREVLAGADRERERERGDEEHTGHDPAGAFAQLARRVETGAPEDEHEQQDEERQPVGLVVPEETPEDRLRVEDVARGGRARRRGRSGGPQMSIDTQRRDAPSAPQRASSAARPRGSTGGPRGHPRPARDSSRGDGSLVPVDIRRV